MNDYDRFSERLNAMLQTDIIPGTIVQSSNNPNNNNNNNIKMSNNTNKLQQSKIDTRSMSALSRRSDLSDNLTGNMAGANYYDFDSFLSMQQQQQHNQHPVSSSANNSRPTSAQPINHQQQQQSFNNYNSNVASLVTTNKQIINDFNSQIHDLSMKNYEAQQKLKNIQQKQDFNGQIENEFAVSYNIYL
jgi:hypothetical protein